MELDNIIRNAPKNYNIDSRGMGRIYYDCMLNNKDRVAQICGPTGKQFTFGYVLQCSIRIAVALQNDGVKPSDVIVISIYNNMYSAIILAAGLFIGATVVGIDEDMSEKDMYTLLQQVMPKVIFAADEVLKKLIKSIKAIGLNTKIVLVDSSNSRYTLFDTYLQECIEEDMFEPYSVKSLHDTAMIFFTSGTTGLPKGFSRSHLSLLSTSYNVMNCNYCWDVIMETSTPAWTVYVNFLTISIILGTPRVIYKYFLPEYYWHFTRHKVTMLMLTIYEALKMGQVEKSKETDLSNLQTMMLGGSILTQSQLNRIKEVFSGVDICNYYGISEIGSISTFTLSNDAHTKTRFTKNLPVGKGFPGVDIKILDLDDKKVLGPNEKGEIRVKVANSTVNYINYNSSDLVDEDGWFKTGDLGYYDNDRCIFVVDRIKEVFKYKLWRVIPSHLEDVILTHPAIDMVFVSGIPHPVDLEHPIAIVTIKSGYDNVLCKDIQNYVAEKVPDYLKLRGGVKIIDKFPITHSGKVKRMLLRSWIIEGKI